ncbi:serine--tRNA ligase, partial [bacterium]|nr:serine--tRNA ligase [bacterium]
MLTINLIREQSSFVIERLKVKNFDATEIVQHVLDLDRRRRELQAESDSIQAQLNTLSREIGTMMKEGRKEEADAARHGIGAMKEKQKQLADMFEDVSREMQAELIRMPNLPHALVAPGRSAEDNVVVRSGGTVP